MMTEAKQSEAVQARWAGAMGVHPDLLRRKDAGQRAEEEGEKLAARLCRQSAEGDEVRRELVERLRTAIAAGTYCIETAEVAGSLLRSTREAI